MERPTPPARGGCLIGCRTGGREGGREGRGPARLTPPRPPPLREPGHPPPGHRAARSPPRRLPLEELPKRRRAPEVPGLGQRAGAGIGGAGPQRWLASPPAAPAAPGPLPLRALAQLRSAPRAPGRRALPPACWGPCAASGVGDPAGRPRVAAHVPRRRVQTPGPGLQDRRPARPTRPVMGLRASGRGISPGPGRHTPRGRRLRKSLWPFLPRAVASQRGRAPALYRLTAGLQPEALGCNCSDFV